MEPTPIMSSHTALIVSFLLLSAGAAFAQEAKPAAQPSSPAPQAAAPSPSALSQSKFLSALYAEIAKRTPQETKAGPGEVAASFHVGANGKIDKVTIVTSTSLAHAGIVKKILAEVQAPPPPGGTEDILQTFKFH